MAIEVFNRHEIKYILDTPTYRAIERQLAERMTLDPYLSADQSSYRVANLYFDTDDNYLIHRSLQKPRYKEKLRLRGYGVPGPEDKVYLEIKKKISGAVNKRRSAIRLSQAVEFIRTGRLPEPEDGQNRQVLHEIAYLLQEYDLKPKLYLAYDRRAYFGREEADLRVSFDSNIRTRRYDLALDKGDHGEQLLPDGLWLMEIKVARSMPFWLARLLSELQIYPTSFSKYGFEYLKMTGSQARDQRQVSAPDWMPKPIGSLVPAPVRNI